MSAKWIKEKPALCTLGGWWRTSDTRNPHVCGYRHSNIRNHRAFDYG
jgi:hypothetical protein